MRTLPLVAALVAGCGSDPAADPVEPTPYVYDGDEVGPPKVDLAALGRDLATLVPTIRALNATPPIVAYAALAGEQTPACPRTYVTDGNTYWADQCTTEAGTAFQGFVFAYDYADMPVGDVWRGRVRLVTGAARVERADGAAVDVAGAAQRMDLLHVSQPVRLHHSVVNGSFAAEGLGLDESWLGTEIRPDLTQFVYEQTELGGRMFVIDGGVSGFGGSLSAVVLDQVTFMDATLNPTCPREPYGLMSARLADGTWIDVEFDGVDSATWQATGPCDGRGRAFYRGELLGEVEADFSSIFAFEGAPW